MKWQLVMLSLLLILGIAGCASGVPSDYNKLRSDVVRALTDSAAALKTSNDALALASKPPPSQVPLVSLKEFQSLQSRVDNLDGPKGQMAGLTRQMNELQRIYNPKAPGDQLDDLQRQLQGMMNTISAQQSQINKLNDSNTDLKNRVYWLEHNR